MYPMRKKGEKIEAGYRHIFKNLPQNYVLVHIYTNTERNTRAFLQMHRIEHPRLIAMVTSGAGNGIYEKKVRRDL